MSVINGRPRGPVVRLLVEKFGTERGTTITHKDIAATINEPEGSHRYTGIVSAWRKTLLDDHAILLVSLPTVGYEMASAGQQVSGGVRRIELSRRRLRRAAKIVAVAPDDQLDERERTMKIHALGVAANAIGAMDTGTLRSKMLEALNGKK